MEQNYSTYEEQAVQPEGSIAKGCLGAFLGALLGAIASGLISAFTQQASLLLGFLIGFLVAKGYELLKGREGKAKIVIVILAIIFAVVLGEVIYSVSTIEMEYRKFPQYFAEEIGIPVEQIPAELMEELMPGRGEVYEAFYNNPETRTATLKDLGISFLFAAIGSIGIIIGLGKKKAVAEPQPVPEDEAEQFSEDNQSVG